MSACVHAHQCRWAPGDAPAGPAPRLWTWSRGRSEKKGREDVFTFCVRRRGARLGADVERGARVSCSDHLLFSCRPIEAKGYDVPYGDVVRRWGRQLQQEMTVVQ